MKTQQQFCRLFQTAPTVALALLPDLPADAVCTFSTPVFRYAGMEFRLDGLLTPEDPQLPLIFIALPTSPDSRFYLYYLASVLAYLHENAWDRPWRGLLVIPHRGLNLGLDGADDDLCEHQVTRVYLDELRQQPDLSAEQLLLLLIAATPAKFADLHQRTLAAPVHHLTPDRLQALVEMIVTDHQRALASVGRYAGLELIIDDLKQSRFAQDLMAEGREQGLREGREQGRKEWILTWVTRQLGHLFGTLSPSLLVRVQALSREQLADLGEALLDFTSIADLEVWLDRLG